MREAREQCDVRSLSATYRTGHKIYAHRHGWAQLLYARSGLMRVKADEQIWFVPPTRALWIPPHMDHEFTVRGEVAFRSLYVAEARAIDGCALKSIEVAPLLGELISHIASLGMLKVDDPTHDRLARPPYGPRQGCTLP